MKILKKILKLNTNNKFFIYTNNLIPIRIATKITNPEVTNANNLVGKTFKFKKFPICPPIRTAKKSSQ